MRKQPESTGLTEAEAEFLSEHRYEARIPVQRFMISSESDWTHSVFVASVDVKNYESEIWVTPSWPSRVRGGSDGGRIAGARVSETGA